MAPIIPSIEVKSKATVHRTMSSTGAGVTKQPSHRRPQRAVINDHRLPSPPAEDWTGALPPHMREYLIRRFKPTKHLAIRDFFANLPGFDFPFIEVFGPANELDIIRLERMFRFPEGPRLFSETPNAVAALRAAERLTKFIHVLTIYAAKFVKRFYPTRYSENAEDELFNYHYAVYEAVNRHLGEDPDWQSSHTNDADLPIVIFLVKFILLGRKRVFDMHPDEGDLGIAADQLVDEYEKKTGRI